MNFTDIHCHILPDIDDGAENQQSTYDMLALAYEDGIKSIICTPHYHIGRMLSDPEEIDRAYRVARQIAKDNFPEMNIYKGQEIYYYSDALEKLKKEELLTLAGTDYVLLEYSTSSQYETIRDSITEMYNAGFLPIVAHAERYGCLFCNLKRVEELVRIGAYIQVNADSFEGGFMNPMRKFVLKMVKENLVHFIASDAHSAGSRKPELSKTYRLIEKKCGRALAERIFLENPDLLLENREL